MLKGRPAYHRMQMVVRTVVFGRMAKQPEVVVQMVKQSVLVAQTLLLGQSARRTLASLLLIRTLTFQTLVARVEMPARMVSAFERLRMR